MGCIAFGALEHSLASNLETRIPPTVLGFSFNTYLALGVTLSTYIGYLYLNLFITLFYLAYKLVGFHTGFSKIFTFVLPILLYLSHILAFHLHYILFLPLVFCLAFRITCFPLGTC